MAFSIMASVVIALSGVVARGVTGARKAAALLRSAKATTSFIVAAAFELLLALDLYEPLSVQLLVPSTASRGADRVRRAAILDPPRVDKRASEACCGGSRGLDRRSKTAGEPK